MVWNGINYNKGKTHMNETLGRLEELYNCQFKTREYEDDSYLELETLNGISQMNKIHIDHCLREYGFFPYFYEAVDDMMVLMYHRNNKKNKK